MRKGWQTSELSPSPGPPPFVLQAINTHSTYLGRCCLDHMIVCSAVTDANEIIGKYGKGKPLAAIVEYVINASMLRVTLLDDCVGAVVQVRFCLLLLNAASWQLCSLYPSAPLFSEIIAPARTAHSS